MFIHLGERRSLDQETFVIGFPLTEHDCRYLRLVVTKASKIGEEIWMPPEEAPAIAPSAPAFAS